VIPATSDRDPILEHVLDAESLQLAAAETGVEGSRVDVVLVLFEGIKEQLGLT
jgi:hypothetical protein